MKKLLALLLAALFVFVMVAACDTPADEPAVADDPVEDVEVPVVEDDDDDADDADDEEAPPVEDDEQEFRVAFSLPPIGNAFHAHMRTLIDAAVAETPDNFHFTVINAVDDSDQLRQVEVFFNEGYDLIGIMPNNGTLLTPIAEEIYLAGIPTIIMNRAIDSDLYTSFVTGDNFDSGRQAAVYLAEWLDGEGDVAVFRSMAGTPIDLDRNAGIMEGFSDFPGINVVIEPDAGFSREGGFEQMQNVLAAHDTVVGIVVQDCEATLGALDAINAAGRDDIQIIVGIGGSQAAMAIYLENDPDHILRGTAAYFPLMGPEGVRFAVRILQGDDTVPHQFLEPSAMITRETVQDFLAYGWPDFGG